MVVRVTLLCSLSLCSLSLSLIFLAPYCWGLILRGTHSPMASLLRHRRQDLLSFVVLHVVAAHREPAEAFRADARDVV